MSEQLFKKAYKKLNSAQKDAVDTIEGSVMVVAGPGTGKTQILTLRIANILLKTDTRPENILALTFTESGARSMRERLRSYIGAEAYRVEIHTFHGFADKLIRNYPDAYPHIIGSRPASDIEKINIIETILQNEEITSIRPIGNPAYYVPHILRSIGMMKQEYITPDVFAEIISAQEKDLALIEKIHIKGAHKGKVRGEYQKKEKAISKNKELLYVFRQYEALLRENNLYDFEDMIFETVEVLKKNEEMLRDLQETHQYILTDEHQDVNGSQNAILEALASFHDSPNLFVVGDEKQAIFRFQGASIENFLYFSDIFKNTKTITLTTNYRSNQGILDASHSLISAILGPASDLRIELDSFSKDKAVVEERSFPHQAIEDDWMVKSIEDDVACGVDPKEIAVIVRTNREVEQFAEAIRKKGLYVMASADGDILSHPITKGVKDLIQATSSVVSDDVIFRILHAPYWGISSDDLIKVFGKQSYDTSLTAIISNKSILKSIGVSDIDSILSVLNLLDSAREKLFTLAPHRVLEYILNESGFLKYVIESEPLEGSRVVRRLYDEVEEMVLRNKISTLVEVNEMLSTRVAYGLPLNAPYIVTNEQAVQVMTAHKSKGLEFDYVYLPHVVDSGWGGRRNSVYFDIPITKHISTDELDSLDDERRLLYVAMTRAKKNLYLSNSSTNAEGKTLTRSRLLEDIEERLLSKIETSEDSDNFNPINMFNNKSNTSVFDTVLLRQLIKDRGLSATALNNYLRSPWDYLYRNMLRIPEIQPLPMLFGTALHGVMERLTRAYSENNTLPNDTDIKKLLESELGKLPLTKEDFVQLLARGLESLFAYTGHISGSLHENMKEEFAISVVLKTGNEILPEIKLTGKLDRLDFNEEGNVVRVIDYKSGKPKTRGVIEGKTKTSNGDYKRQLVFYMLLLSLYEDKRYACKEGVLSFIEPDAKGATHEETFTITDDEIEDLKKEIIRVSLEIANGDFLNKPCDPNISNYCDLAQSLFKD